MRNKYAIIYVKEIVVKLLRRPNYTNTREVSYEEYLRTIQSVNKWLEKMTVEKQKSKITFSKSRNVI